MVILYPTVIQPLFNKLSPLSEGDLRNRIEALAVKLKFPLKHLYEIDGSKRSSHSNAYFFGLPWVSFMSFRWYHILTVLVRASTLWFLIRLSSNPSLRRWKLCLHMSSDTGITSTLPSLWPSPSYTFSLFSCFSLLSCMRLPCWVLLTFPKELRRHRRRLWHSFFSRWFLRL